MKVVYAHAQTSNNTINTFLHILCFHATFCSIRCLQQIMNTPIDCHIVNHILMKKKDQRVIETYEVIENDCQTLSF